VEDESQIRYIRDQILDTYLSDNLKARVMMSDGSYEYIKPEPGHKLINSQQNFLDQRM
jgi:polyphosphate kinase